MAQMPLRTRFDHEELARAACARDVLARVIAQSGGYALVEMRKLGLMPSLDDLMAVIDGDSLSFALDHYDLDLKQKRKIAHLFTEQLGSAKLLGAELTEREVDALLDAGHPWINGAQITRRQMVERPAALGAALNASTDGTVGHAVERALVQMTASDVIRLDERVWEGCLALLRGRPDVLALPEGKARYKRMILEKADREGVRPQWRDFVTWSFESSDEDFFWSLISDPKWSAPSYEELVAVPGCAAFTDKIGYARRVNPGSIKALDVEELAENLQEVRKIWMELCTKGKGYTTPVSFEARSEQFAAVVDVAWMSHALHTIPHIASRLSMGEDQEERVKGLWARRQVLKAFLEAPAAVCTAQGTYEIVNMAGTLRGNWSPICKEAEEDSDAQIAEAAIRAVVPFCVDASQDEGAGCLMRPGGLAEESFFEALVQVSTSAPSANLLWMLLTMAKDKAAVSPHSFHGAEPYLVLACQVSMGTTRDSGSLLWDALAPEARRRLKPQFEGSDQSGDPRTDLIGVRFETLFELPSSARRALMTVHPNFVEKMRAAGGVPDSEMMLWALRNVDKDSGPAVALFRALMELAGPARLKCPKLENQLRTHPRASELVDPSFLTLSSWAGAVSRARELSQALREALRVNAVRGSSASGGASQEDEGSAKEMSLAVERLDARGRKLFGSLPHEQARAALNVALGQGSYALFENFAQWREPATGAKSLWEAHVRDLPEVTFCKALSEPAFAQMIRDSVDYNDACSVGLDFKSAPANARACKGLLPLFDTDSCGALALFSLAARQEFAAEFVVENMASRAVYAYKLMPGRDGLMPGLYSPGQIIKLFDRLEAEGGFFCSQDVNARVESLLRENFVGCRTAYLDVLDRAHTRPKLYALLFNSDLCDQFGDEREAPSKKMKKNKEQRSEPRQAAGVRWAADHVDWEVVAKGIELILDEAWERRTEENFNPKLALDAVRAPLRASRARGLKDLPGDPDGYALISEDLSLRLANILLRKAPLVFYATQSLGAIAHLPTRFELDPGAFDCPEMVERLFFPDRALKPEYFDLRQWVKDSVVGIGKAAVQWLAREGRKEDIKLIDWMIKEVAFRENELAYRERKSVVPGFPESTEEGLECCSGSPEFMGALRVAVEKFSLEEVIDMKPNKRRSMGRI